MAATWSNLSIRERINMLELFMGFADVHALGMLSTDRAVTFFSQLAGGVLTIFFLVAVITLGWAKSLVGIISTVIIFGILMAFTVRPELIIDFGVWFLGLFI